MQHRLLYSGAPEREVRAENDSLTCMLALTFTIGFFIFQNFAIAQSGDSDCGPNEIFDTPSLEFKLKGHIRGHEVYIAHSASGDSYSVDVKTVPKNETPVVQKLMCGRGTVSDERIAIANDQLSVIVAQHDRYSPHHALITKSFKLNDHHTFVKVAEVSSHPYAEALARLPRSMKKKDLAKLIADRDFIVQADMNSYAPHDLRAQDIQICLDVVKVAYEKAKLEYAKGRTSEAKRVLSYFRSEIVGEQNCRKTIDRSNLDMACWLRNDAHCIHLQHAPIELMRNTALLMTELGMKKTALEYLRLVIAWEPPRRATHINFAEAFAGTGQAGFALMSRAIADGLKGKLTGTAKQVDVKHLRPIAEAMNLKCANDETLFAEISEIPHAPSFHAACRKGSTRKSVLYWNPSLDKPQTALTECPASKQPLEVDQPIRWDTNLNYKLPAAMLKNCVALSAAVRLPSCRWAIACDGGLDNQTKAVEGKQTGITDFVFVDELKNEVKRIHRSSATDIELAPQGKDLVVKEKIEFSDSINRKPVLNAQWSLQCSDMGCNAGPFDCGKSETASVQFDTVTLHYDSEDIFGLALHIAITTDAMKDEYKPGQRVAYTLGGTDFFEIDVDAMAEAGRRCRKP